MIKKNKSVLSLLLIVLAAVVIGQAISYVLDPGSWQTFMQRLPGILSMIAFWGPVVAVIAGFLVWVIMRLMGFSTIEMIRRESVEENNPTPAIIFIGTFIASLLLLMLVIRP